MSETGQNLPNKLYFRMGEVSRMAGVEPHVLRYWESEFPGIEPKKAGSNHRMYRRKDVELILQIKHLLYEQRFTIEGARKHLADAKSRKKTAQPQPPAPKVQTSLFGAPGAGIDATRLEPLRRELAEILSLLKDVS